MKKKLLIFNTWHGPNTTDLSAGNNSTYLEGYNTCFDQVLHLVLIGKKEEVVINGQVEYHFAGKGSIVDLLLAPFRLYKFVKKHQPHYLLTYEQVWLWWIASWIRIFTKVPVYLLPVTYPEQMYKITGKSLSNMLPIWLERIFLRWSYRASHKIVTSYNVGNYINWMQANKIIQKKLIIVNVLPESVVFPAFMKRLEELQSSHTVFPKDVEKIRLIFAGRLHPEKMTDHLVRAMPLVLDSVPNAVLTIIGQGPEKQTLTQLADQLGVQSAITFHDYFSHAELPDQLLAADIFVSPITGHAFREAAMCGLPIVAYDIDWIKGFLVSGEHFYGVEQLDYRELAKGIIVLCQNQALRNKIAANGKIFANKYWSTAQLRPALNAVFETP